MHEVARTPLLTPRRSVMQHCCGAEVKVRVGVCQARSSVVHVPFHNVPCGVDHPVKYAMSGKLPIPHATRRHLHSGQHTRLLYHVGFCFVSLSSLANLLNFKRLHWNLFTDIVSICIKRVDFVDSLLGLFQFLFVKEFINIYVRYRPNVWYKNVNLTKYYSRWCTASTKHALLNIQKRLKLTIVRLAADLVTSVESTSHHTLTLTISPHSHFYEDVIMSTVADVSDYWSHSNVDVGLVAVPTVIISSL